MKVLFKVYDVAINDGIKKVAFPTTAKASQIDDALKTAGAIMWKPTGKIKLEVTIDPATYLFLPLLDRYSTVVACVSEVIDRLYADDEKVFANDTTENKED